MLPELKGFFLKTSVVRSTFVLVACKSVTTLPPDYKVQSLQTP